MTRFWGLQAASSSSTPRRCCAVSLGHTATSDVLIGGIEKREIVIVDYDPLWPEKFQRGTPQSSPKPWDRRRRH